MRTQKQIKQSESMKQVWQKHRMEMIAARKENEEITKQIQSYKIKQHFIEHPEHRTALSNAQIKKWSKIKAALAYCEINNINLGE
jgi:hypothetical protein